MVRWNKRARLDPGDITKEQGADLFAGLGQPIGEFSGTFTFEPVYVIKCWACQQPIDLSKGELVSVSGGPLDEPRAICVPCALALAELV